MKVDLAQGSALRAAVYGRFSSDLQNQRSAKDQARECRSFAERSGWSVVVEELDEGVRAADVEGRVGFRRLVALARARRFDVLVVEELSRFSRDLFAAFGELAELTKHGVRLATVRDGLLDLTDAPGLIQASVGFTFAQVETKKIGERSKRGLTAKVLDGFSGGGVAPYGYRRKAVMQDIDGEVPKSLGVKFEPDPNEGPIVQRIFQEYADGVAKHAIATALTRDGILTRRAGQTYAGGTVRGTWTAAGISAVLSNPIAIGTMCWNKSNRRGAKGRGGRKAQVKTGNGERVIRENFCVPIVSRDLWNRAQVRLQADLRVHAQRSIANPNQKRTYTLSGFLVCASCGRPFSIGGVRSGAPAYRCSTRTVDRAACSNLTVVSQPGLEARVRHVIESVMKDPGQLQALVAEHNQRIDATNKTVLSALDGLQMRLVEKTGEKDRLVEAVRKGRGTIDALVTALEGAEDEIATLTRQIAEVRTRLQPRLEPLVDLRDLELGEARLLEDEEGVTDEEERVRVRLRNKALLRGVLDAIQVYGDGSIYVRFREAGLFGPVESVRLDTAFSQEQPPPLSESRRALLQARLHAEADLEYFLPDEGEEMPNRLHIDIDGGTATMRPLGIGHPELRRHGLKDRRDEEATALFASLGDAKSFWRPQGDSNLSILATERHEIPRFATRPGRRSRPRSPRRRWPNPNLAPIPTKPFERRSRRLSMPATLPG